LLHHRPPRADDPAPGCGAGRAIMTPYDPPPATPEPFSPSVETPADGETKQFWNYLDLLFLMSLFMPCLFVASILVRTLSHFLALTKPLQALIGQLIAYVLIFGSMYGLFHIRYERPFWRSLGWKLPVRGAALSFFFGPLLAIGVAFLGYF